MGLKYGFPHTILSRKLLLETVQGWQRCFCPGPVTERGVLPQLVHLESHLPGLRGRDLRQPEAQTPPVRASQIPQPTWKGMKSCRGGKLLLFPTSYSEEKHTLSPQVNSTAERQILVFVHKPQRKNKDRKHTLSNTRPSSPWRREVGLTDLERRISTASDDRCSSP